jgi:glycosyltransferase involved in cell wall biosynthesis
LELSKQITSKNVKFLFVGNGILEAELKTESRNDTRFVFLDFQNQSQMPILYRLTDIFMLPSLGPGETWGMAINEALASGTKVLASKFCGGAIDLLNCNNGMVFNPKTEILEVRVYIQNYQVVINPIIQTNSLLKGHSYKEIIEAVKNEIKR